MAMVVEVMAFLIFVGVWMFVGLLACAVLLKVFSMALGVGGMELLNMIIDLWISKVNKWSGNGKN